MPLHAALRAHVCKGGATCAHMVRPCCECAKEAAAVARDALDLKVDRISLVTRPGACARAWPVSMC
jgi:hypothetical protein